MNESLREMKNGIRQSLEAEREADGCLEHEQAYLDALEAERQAYLDLEAWTLTEARVRARGIEAHKQDALTIRTQAYRNFAEARNERMRARQAVLRAHDDAYESLRPRAIHS